MSNSKFVDNLIGSARSVGDKSERTAQGVVLVTSSHNFNIKCSPPAGLLSTTTQISRKKLVLFFFGYTHTFEVISIHVNDWS